MNANIYNGNIQPNHKEYKIWVNDEGIIKTWNGIEWIEQSGTSDDNGGGSGSGGSDSWKYVDITDYTSEEKEMIFQILPLLVRLKVSDNQNIVMCGSGLYYGGIDYVNMVNAIAFDVSAKMTLGDGYDFATIREAYDFMVKINVIPIPFDELAFITKEEFYSHPQ